MCANVSRSVCVKSARVLEGVCVRCVGVYPLCLRMWVVVCDSHGSVIPLITTAAWRNRLPFAVTEKESALRLTNLTSKFNILLISPTNTGLQGVVRGAELNLFVSIMLNSLTVFVLLFNFWKIENTVRCCAELCCAFSKD